MDIFTVILFTVILICILGGIGSGFHIAFRMAEGRSKDTACASSNKKSLKKKKPWLKRTPNEASQNRLSKKIHKQDDASFQEFSCQFTGENPEEKLNSARKKQDASYNCLSQEKKA